MKLSELRRRFREGVKVVPFKADPPKQVTASSLYEELTKLYPPRQHSIRAVATPGLPPTHFNCRSSVTPHHFKIDKDGSIEQMKVIDEPISKADYRATIEGHKMDFLIADDVLDKEPSPEDRQKALDWFRKRFG